MAGGVLPVMKHMPGHGLSHVDTHHDLPTVTVPMEELTAVDFAPFRALADLPMAMTAHLVFAALDAKRPATQSPTMIRVIREVIGFKGLLMSDDLNMQALAGTLGDRTARTIAAGVDIALHCKGDMAEMVEVAGAAGVMGADTRARAEAAVAARRPATGDVTAALAELAHG
jgi:beta-N-acetylhexosaminidase